ncbi:MAG: cell surface glycoprotein, partial [Actinobacteria bacterium]|nr:cell surface glycoprotein [Actinomycetota bacterium]
FTLYAQWTANTLTVTTDEQGGSAVSNGSTTTGASMSSPGTPTRSGYTFNGWFTASSGGSAISFPYAHGQTANFTLYAQWTRGRLRGG